MATGVVITGIGLLTPFGRGAARTFDALVEGRSAVGPISRFDPAEQRSRIAAEVRDPEAGDDLQPTDARTFDRFQLYALLAALDAARDAGLGPGGFPADRTAVFIGTGIGGIETIERTHEALRTKGPRRISPYFIPAAIPNLAASLVAMRLGLRGPCLAPASACASGAHALGEAFLAVRDGRVDLAVAGGSEAAVTPLGMAGFAAMRALSERNDAPERASRPFDRERDGFVLGEGAGVLVLEREEDARARGARLRGRFLGYGASGDAHHITQPDPDARGMAEAMRRALADAGLAPRDVGYLNAHATSTPLGDRLEARAVRELFGADAPPVSSTKSAMGHLLGAAGAVEAGVTLLALERALLPPTLNLEQLDPEIDLDAIPLRARAADARVGLSNAFGFGGTNASLLFGRAD